MSKIFSASENLKKEYACEVVRIGEMIPVEGSDFLAKTEIHPNMPIVVRKDEVHEGQVMFYVDTESQLCEDFLHVNNQYRDSAMNADPQAAGFFERNGRVRMIRLRGQESMGYLFGQDAMSKFCPAVAKLNLEDYIGEVFDTVDGKEFVKAYMPPAPSQSTKGLHEGKRNRKIKHFDRMVPGEFSFHYDTDQLEKNIHKFSPEDHVTISVKIHGTSAIFANVRVNRKLSFWEKIRKFFGADIPTREWGNVYASRSVIKNQYINEGVTAGYYDADIWGEWNERIKDYIPCGWTLYGEIVGYVNSGKMVQKDFDYGCKPGESKLMIYRISQELEDGTHKEWDVPEVRAWTERLIHDLEGLGEHKLANMLHPIDIVYHGELGMLYPDLDTNMDIRDWRDQLIHRMANDKVFHMEENEPMCIHKVPREGLVIRKDNDPLKEAFKLKTMKFRNKEAKEYDAGNVDIEAEQGYAQ